MSVIVLNNPAGLRLKFDLGKDELTGNTKVKSKTFSNVKYNASNEDVYEVARASWYNSIQIQSFYWNVWISRVLG